MSDNDRNPFRFHGPKRNPRTMVWAGGPAEKPEPFMYYIDDSEDGASTSVWTRYPMPPLIYDDNGDKARTPGGAGWPIDFTYDGQVTCLVHNHNGKLVAIYVEQDEGGWEKVSGNISLGLQQQVTFSAGSTFRVDFVG